MNLKLYVKKQLQEQLEELASVQNSLNNTLNDLEHFLLSTINFMEELNEFVQFDDFKLEKAVETRDIVASRLLKLKNVIGSL